MSKYDFTAIEAKWQRYWAEHDTFHAEDDYTKPKCYALVEFPYPSGRSAHRTPKTVYRNGCRFQKAENGRL